MTIMVSNYLYTVKQKLNVMQKILELIEQIRFAELKKIDRLSNAQKGYLNQDVSSEQDAAS
jgi:hypothetical protein